MKKDMKGRVVSIHSSGLYVFHQHIWAFETAIYISSVLGSLIFLDPHAQVGKACNKVAEFGI